MSLDARVAAIAAALAVGITFACCSGGDALRAITYANTALAASALLYLVHAWLGAEAVGRAATTLAAAGATGVLAALAAGMLHAGQLAMGLCEDIALLSAAAVLAYLGIERAYRTRSGGMVVMAAVMAAVLCQIWLIARGFTANALPPRGLASYWEAGHRFAFGLGYCSLAAGATLAMFAHGGARYSAPAAVHALLSVGAPVLALGAGMGGVWILFEPGAVPPAAMRVAASAVASALVLAAWMGLRDPRDPRAPRLTLAAFAVASAGLLASAPAAAG